MEQTILCLDMESVLTPEIWINVAKKTGIKELELTTKDIADYDELMNHRLKILEKENINLKYIQDVISEMDPFDWVVEFLTWAKERMQVIILSDTFREFAKPLIEKMNNPTIFCHNLIIDENWNISGYKLRLNNQKQRAVEKFKELNFKTIAVWDSFNDTWMLQEAHTWIFFRPSAKTAELFPHLPIVNNYEELKVMIEENL